MADLKKFYSVEDILKMFNINNKLYVYDLIKSGKLEAFKFGNRFYITEEALQKYIENNKVEPKDIK